MFLRFTAPLIGGLVLVGCETADWIAEPPVSLLPEADAALALQARDQALETLLSGHRLTWTRPDGSGGGAIEILESFRGEGGAVCRRFVETVALAERRVRKRMEACRTEDGKWIEAAQGA